MLFAVAGGFAACQQSVEFHPYDYERFYRRHLLVLEGTPLPPLPKAIQEEAQARIEAVLLASPHLAKVISRAEAQQRMADEPTELFNYEVLSDTLSVLALVERQQSSQVALAQDVTLGAVTQMLHLPCPDCEEIKSRLLMNVQILDLETTEVLWRLHVSRNVVEDISAAEQAKEGSDLISEAEERLALLLAPKWQRLRFDNLKRL